MAQHFGGRWIACFALKLNVEYKNSNAWEAQSWLYFSYFSCVLVIFCTFQQKFERAQKSYRPSLPECHGLARQGQSGVKVYGDPPHMIRQRGYLVPLTPTIPTSQFDLLAHWQCRKLHITPWRAFRFIFRCSCEYENANPTSDSQELQCCAS